jgi:anaerobic selenocysteine-containing dehydrogenase
VLDRFAEARSNHDLVCGLGQRLGQTHPGFRMTAREILDHTLQASGRGTLDDAADRGWIDCALPFEDAHFESGFAHPDGRFRFKPDWSSIGAAHAVMPRMPDYMAAIEASSAEHPFRLVVPPARSFLNTSFTETPGSVKREGAPRALLHPSDLAKLGLQDGGAVRIGNQRGAVTVAVKSFADVQPGVIIVEGIWPNDSFEGGLGINQLIGADRVPPNGGSAFHDTAVWLRG